jgi:hypothetical protein
MGGWLVCEVRVDRWVEGWVDRWDGWDGWV